MDPFQFLLLAERLLNSDAHPAGCRSAVSRAYYAAHHCLGQLIERTGVSLKRGPESHADIWRHLAGAADAELIQVGSRLSRLRHERNQADYELAGRQPKNVAGATALVALARSLIETARIVESDAGRFSAVAAALRVQHSLLRGLSKS